MANSKRALELSKYFPKDTSSPAVAEAFFTQIAKDLQLELQSQEPTAVFNQAYEKIELSLISGQLTTLLYRLDFDETEAQSYLNTMDLMGLTEAVLRRISMKVIYRLNLKADG